MIFIWEKLQSLWTAYRPEISAANPVIRERMQYLWTDYRTEISVAITVIVIYLATSYGKDLWDLMDLLIVPLTIAIIAGLFHLAQRERDREMAEAESKRDRELASNLSRELALQLYQDRIGDMVMEQVLPQSEPGSDERLVARARTLAVLPRLDGRQKGSVLQLLHQLGLINANDAVIDLEDANLTKANLRDADLRRVDLAHADLQGADLTSAWLTKAILRGANMHRATLVDARMTEADLSGARLIEANLGTDNLASYTDLHCAILRQAQLCGADLRRADLTMADLTGADLEQANLQWAQLNGADLTGANLQDADTKRITYDPDTKWPEGFNIHPSAVLERVADSIPHARRGEPAN